MQITIDTNKDSHEDIKKAIKLLASMVGQENVLSSETPRNIFESQNPTQNSNESVFGSLFDAVENEAHPSSTVNAEKSESNDEMIEYY